MLVCHGSNLHWLRSTERIDFKLAVLVYRCLHCLAPRYLSDHIQCVADSNRRHLQSSFSLQLEIRRTRLSTVGGIAASGTVCHPSSHQLPCSLFFGTASRLTYFPDYFPHNCCLRLVLYTVHIVV